MISVNFRRAIALGLLTATTALAGFSAAKAQELVLGVIGNSKDMVQPYSPTDSVSADSMYDQLYDGLTSHDSKGGVVMRLAESMTPNAAMDVWTVKLRPNVKRHDGKPFTADDVIASIRYMLDKANHFVVSSQIDFVDPAKIRKVDDLTVEFTLNRPFGLFANAFADDHFRMRAIAADGSVVGTGPFTLDSFTPGQETRLTRFEDYWGEKPGFDKLRIIGFRDQQAVTNALRGGQIDIAYSVPYTDVPSLTKDPKLKTVISGTTTYPMLAVRVDTEPFKDPRVLEALKLVVDRQQIVDNAFSGYATIANDYLGNNTACPVPSVAQRVQDIAKAKQLLAEAGKTNLRLEVVTDGAYSGMMEMAQLFAQQAAQAGITIKVRRLDPATFLNRWREWPFLVSLASGPYETGTLAALLPDQGENATHFDDAEYNDLAKRLESTSDLAAQCKLITQMQAVEYKRSGHIVPAYPENITVYRDTVSGLKPDFYGRTPIQYAGVTVKK
ncbi:MULTISPECIES: ABC transporter substrate-binding protein [unclassified Rhizobium]|uniref:ABC transporter substrate-binding protein n=1 Tax=unclassified Rhizobium TaxID=2613769 RepID=UPI0038189FB9